MVKRSERPTIAATLADGLHSTHFKGSDVERRYAPDPKAEQERGGRPSQSMPWFVLHIVTRATRAESSPPPFG
jgi:hypothetical protein